MVVEPFRFLQESKVFERHLLSEIDDICQGQRMEKGDFRVFAATPVNALVSKDFAVFFDKDDVRMVIGDDDADTVVFAIDDSFGIEDMRRIFPDRHGDLAISDVLFAQGDDVWRQGLEDLQARIGIAAESADSCGNVKAWHPCPRHGDAHAVLHQVGRDPAVDEAHRFAQFPGCRRRGIGQGNRFRTPRRRRHILFDNADHFVPHSSFIHDNPCFLSLR